VTTGAEGEHEGRTRVVCHLPLNSVQEERAFKAVIQCLRSQRRTRVGVTGYTYSSPTSFSGGWWSPQGKEWLSDRVVLLLIDYQVELTDRRVSLSEKIAELKEKIQDAYTRHGRPQEEVWVVSFPVTRHT
jgi:hypothetical protein